MEEILNDKIFSEIAQAKLPVRPRDRWNGATRLAPDTYGTVARTKC